MRRFLPIRVALLALLAFAAGGASRAAAEPELVLAYDIYFSGITIMQLEARLNLVEGAQGRYAIAIEGRTVGLIDSVRPIAFLAMSEGISNGHGLQPARYATSTEKRSKRKGLTVAFLPHGAPVTRFTPPDDEEEPALPELLKDSIDPGSALLTLIRTLSDTASCTGTIQVFDGKRRYDVTLADLPHQMLQKSSYSIYSGEAQRCHATMVPLHGFKPGKRNMWDDTTIWFGHVLDGAPPLPVRIDAEINIGAVRLHLASARWLDQRASR